ncbi:hypothetical protein [Sulfuracidifex metallicus]|uniref:Uncharacterized protein n=1 Tax=Sulfuracidifex metallicus DSM 6482 = JCM 9184 TaxID=523847 RepID=A0A6A9QPN5_SULME|nr:hypothetical protein [Sulfuracidifex metallicus]MUN29245.1 hypothetical protein [Sulfuracidifex metallicus DSM 6482 = JCM 9184]WOE50238.1 hypothetical protein RQ359_001754 [Sulfuracidifex metallicus DSM 6482 = JCM 9184]
MGLFKKEKTINTSVPLEQIVNSFVTYLQGQGWKVQQLSGNGKAVIQAQKAGILRDIFTADRALTFTLEQAGNNQVLVRVGAGKWIQNIAVTAIETIVLSELFLFVDVPEMLWNTHVESELLKRLEQIAQGMTV